MDHIPRCPVAGHSEKIPVPRVVGKHGTFRHSGVRIEDTAPTDHHKGFLSTH